KGTLLVEAAKQAKIDIPVFCYHPKLAPVGACRMCLVQIEKMPRLQTACSTPVADGMVVYTRSAEATAAQRGVVEMLLTNHPLDCPVCDKGGECPLQDITFAYGPGVSRFYEPKRHFRKPIQLSDYIVLDRERCIMCYRCVRFQREVAGDESLTVVDRGSYSEIAVMPGRTFDSPFSGNTIELCPVGALTSRLFRFTARCWDLTNVPSICSMCSVGCNVWVGVRDWSVKRITARENTPVDDGWLCDRGRFTYAFANSAERLQQPLVRRDGQLRPATWDEALRAAARGLADAGSAAAGLASVQWTNEELYLFQKLFRVALGSNSVDHAPRQPLPAATPFGYDALAGSIAALETAQSVILVDVTPLVHQPVLDLRLKKAKRRGAKLVVIASECIDLVADAAAWLQCPPGGEARTFLALLKALAEQQGAALADAGLVATLAALDGPPVPQAAVAALAAAAPGRAALLYRRDLAAGTAGATFVAGVRALADLLGLSPASGATVAGPTSRVRSTSACTQRCSPASARPTRRRGRTWPRSGARRHRLAAWPPRTCRRPSPTARCVRSSWPASTRAPTRAGARRSTGCRFWSWPTSS
ncbi:MAG: NADH-quinone oxidoreductase subunit NuoG, partial [Chloroflexi bacterium]|nr:NADH-quinone oxidoreductase subunit NuoG [Chloroflexota bacterium]